MRKRYLVDDPHDSALDLVWVAIVGVESTTDGKCLEEVVEHARGLSAEALLERDSAPLLPFGCDRTVSRFASSEGRERVRQDEFTVVTALVAQSFSITEQCPRINSTRRADPWTRRTACRGLRPGARRRGCELLLRRPRQHGSPTRQARGAPSR